MRLYRGFYRSLQPQFTACLQPVYGLRSALCVAMIVVHKPIGQQFNSPAAVEMHAQKKRNTVTFKHYERQISAGF